MIHIEAKSNSDMRLHVAYTLTPKQSLYKNVGERSDHETPRVPHNLHEQSISVVLQ
jgi:hypothetical protein